MGDADQHHVGADGGHCPCGERKPSRAAQSLGRKGGRIGGKTTGASKRRSPEQYAAIQAKALHTRRVKAARRMLAGWSHEVRADGATADWVRDVWGADVLRDALAMEE